MTTTDEKIEEFVRFRMASRLEHAHDAADLWIDLRDSLRELAESAAEVDRLRERLGEAIALLNATIAPLEALCSMTEEGDGIDDVRGDDAATLDDVRAFLAKVTP